MNMANIKAVKKDRITGEVFFDWITDNVNWF